MLANRELYSKSTTRNLRKIAKDYNLPVDIQKGKANLVEQFEAATVPDEAKKELENLIKIKRFSKNSFFVDLVQSIPSKETLSKKLKDYRDEHKGRFSNMKISNGSFDGVYTYMDKGLRMTEDGVLVSVDNANPVCFEIHPDTKRAFIRASTTDKATLARKALSTLGFSLSPFDYSQIGIPKTNVKRKWNLIAAKFLKKEGVEIE